MQFNIYQCKIFSSNLRLEKICKAMDFSFIESISAFFNIGRSAFFRDTLRFSERAMLCLKWLCMGNFERHPLSCRHTKSGKFDSKNNFNPE